MAGRSRDDRLPPAGPGRRDRGSRRPRWRAAVAWLAACLSAGAAFTAPAATAVTARPQPVPPLSDAWVRRELRTMVRDAGFVSAAVLVRDGGRRFEAAAGEAEPGSGRPAPGDGFIRAASATKSFTATVVLQLVAEHRLSLRDPVERWLPGVVAGHGNDGRAVTVGNLLQHTSGLYDFARDFPDSAAAFERRRFQHLTARQLVGAAMRHRPEFRPAAAGEPRPRWDYSNTNYLVLGLIIDKVTGRGWRSEVRDRVIRPLRLRDTYLPGDDTGLRTPFAHTYQRFPDAPGWVDTTVRTMGWAGAAGELVTTPHDLDRFLTALLTGRLLPPAQLAAMRRTVPISQTLQRFWPGAGYGLGILRQPLSCGGYRWGHPGDVEGTMVRSGYSTDARRGLVLTADGTSSDEKKLAAAERAVQRFADRVLCRRGGDQAAQAVTSTGSPTATRPGRTTAALAPKLTPPPRPGSRR